MGRLLEGKVAIVTGSGQGIGRCIALDFAQNGAKIITNNRRPGSSINAFEKMSIEFSDAEREELMKFNGDATSTASEIISMGGEAYAVFADVGKQEDARRLVQSAIEKWGRVDIIVNNASSNWTGNIMDMDEDIWETQISSKLSGSFYMMHYALPYMKKNGFGRILNANSDAFAGLSGYAAYGAANAGVIALTKAAAKDLSGTGITVNAYTPLARTRSWFNARANYRIQGVSAEIIEQNAPEAMKSTAEGMVPFLSYLSAEEAENITGRVFQLAADGVVGIWSESKIIKTIKQVEGFWTFDELRKRVSSELLNDD